MTRSPSAALAACVVWAAAPITAQSNPDVADSPDLNRTARVTSGFFGRSGLYATPLDPSLTIDLDVQSAGSPRIRMVGGFTGDPAAMLIGLQVTAVPLGSAAQIYVGAGAVPLVGFFDAAGEFGMPFDPTMPALVGADVFAQGVHFIAPTSGGGLQVSQGLSLSFLDAGATATPTTYRGPAMTAVLEKSNRSGTWSYGVSCDVVVAEPLYELRMIGMYSDPYGTAMHFELVTLANPPVAPEPSSTRLHEYAWVGPAPGPAVEIWISQVEADGTAGPFELAAVFDTAF